MVEVVYDDAALQAMFARAPAIVQQELMQAVTEADNILEREIKDGTPTATGIGRASWFSYETAIPGGALGVVGTAFPHMIFVELGTQPHFVPIEPLQDWARVKFKVSEKEATRIAYAVSRKIAQRGTLGVGMMHRAYARLKPGIERRFIQARDQAVKRMRQA